MKKIVLIDTGERRFPEEGELYVYLGSSSRPPCWCDDPAGIVRTPTDEGNFAILRTESNDFREERKTPGPRAAIVDSLAGIKIDVWSEFATRSKYNFRKDEWEFDGRWDYPMIGLRLHNATIHMCDSDKLLVESAIRNAGGIR